MKKNKSSVTYRRVFSNIGGINPNVEKVNININTNILSYKNNEEEIQKVNEGSDEQPAPT